jgi:hypothetical protein
MLLLFLFASCIAPQAVITPISPADNDQTQTWIFILNPSGELQKNGIYHCKIQTGNPVCTKAKIKN